MGDEKANRSVWGNVICTGISIGLIGFVGLLLLPDRFGSRPSRQTAMKAEITQLMLALEDFRTRIGHGSYPPSSTDDEEAVSQFLAKAFPKYHGGLPEKYRHLDAATSLVFWLGGVTDKNAKPIGFSADPNNPFDATNPHRIDSSYEFETSQLQNDNGLLVMVPHGNNGRSDPFVYFTPDSKGEYHGAWHKCQPCRDSNTGEWISPTKYQLFGPGLDGRYGAGVQYPSGADYDDARKDDMSTFTTGATMGDDMP